MCRMLHIYSFISLYSSQKFCSPGKHIKTTLWHHSEMCSLCNLIFQSMRIKTRTFSLLKNQDSTETVNTLFLDWCCTLMSMQHIFNKVFQISDQIIWMRLELNCPCVIRQTQDYFSLLSKKDSMWMANLLHKDNKQ